MYSYFSRRDIDWNKYISNSVNDMLNAGIDIVSDGQTRDPMIQIFTRKLKGCRIRGRTEVIDKIEYVRPITINDQKYVKTLIPKKIQLKGLITGPYTLANSCIDLYYNDEKKLAFDFAYALAEEVKNLQKIVDIIGIDEPFFSNFMPNYAKDLIEIIIKNINRPTTLHVCGDVSKIIPDIFEIPVDILSHEFKASPHLMDTFSKYSFSQKICLGSVRSDDSEVETVDDIENHIRKALNMFDGKIVQISPDCGQRYLLRDIAFKKLKNLVLAGDKINGR